MICSFVDSLSEPVTFMFLFSRLSHGSDILVVSHYAHPFLYKFFITDDSAFLTAKTASSRGLWHYTVGLVGKPSAGKSTFYNAATRAGAYF